MKVMIIVILLKPVTLSYVAAQNGNVRYDTVAHYFRRLDLGYGKVYEVKNTMFFTFFLPNVHWYMSL